jgi:amidophosphoribosyltransferase
VDGFEASCFSGVYITGDVTQANIDNNETPHRDGAKRTQEEAASLQLDLGLETVE